MKKLWWIILVVALLPFAIGIFFKPSRVFLPELVGVKCPMENLCIDDVDRLDEAKNISKEAIESIQGKLGNLSYKPKFIFCSMQKCFESFGFKKAAAQTLGTVVTVVGPRGWTGYYIEHELVHQWLADKFGGFQLWLSAPDWLTEGMAYTFSDDPRTELSEPWQSYRSKFKLWYRDIDKRNLVEEIRNVL